MFLLGKNGPPRVARPARGGTNGPAEGRRRPRTEGAATDARSEEEESSAPDADDPDARQALDRLQKRTDFSIYQISRMIKDLDASREAGLSRDETSSTLESLENLMEMLKGR